MTFETIKILCLRIQRSEEYISDQNVQAMRFSYNWWLGYQKRCGIKYVRRRGNQTYHPERDIEEERARILALLKDFPPGQIKNYIV